MRPPAALLAAVAALGLTAPAVATAAPAQAPRAAVTIGLFVPTRGAGAAEGAEATAAAEIAIEAANASGGVSGRTVRLATAPSDLPWEAATGALVKLIYDEGAAAVVGALDGPSAHLAEQVIARARGQAVFVTPWATEPALTRIGIPWFFRIVPDDGEQARLLAGEIFSKRRIARAAVWVADSFDARAAAAAFVEAAPPGTVTGFQAGQPGARDALLARVRREEFGAVVLCASSGEASGIAGALRRAGSRALLAGWLRLNGPAFAAGAAGDGALILTPGAGAERARDAFVIAFRARRGAPPSPLALYTHDAVKLLVSALRATGRPGGGTLADELASVRIEGLTGTVGFDERRDRVGSLALAVRAGGRP